MNQHKPKPKKGKSAKQSAKVFVRNRRARFDYRIVETIECGLMLAGWEVKSIRAGKANLSGAYIQFRANGPILIGAQLTPLQSCDLSSGDIDPERTRPLLMKKSEIRKLGRAVRSGNFSCVPLEIYQGKSSYLKIAVALAQGRKRHDKRELIKEREWQRSKARAEKRSDHQNGD